MATTVINTIFRLRRGTTVQWAGSLRILEEGEPGFDTDLHILKVGDGLSLWGDLPSIAGGGGSGETPPDLAAHVADPTPHSVYDDGPSLVLLYQNAKV